jgi:hypothetical protein
MKKFLICTPSYSENNGGAIALHKLCHLLNQNNREAYLFPIVENLQINSLNYKKILPKFIVKQIKKPFKILKTNKSLNTPVLYNLPIGITTGEFVVIYPEITFGNPLQATHVVRWLLHNPGHDTATGKETKEYFFGKNELYFRYASFFKEFQNQGSTTSSHLLTITHFPLDKYNEQNAAEIRTGSAYCIRKGFYKKIEHDLSKSILIDNKKHNEISKIFKSVKTFISYDTYTVYSEFAALSGCDSIVIPDDNISIDQWRPHIEDRYGIAYGYENLEWARKTRSNLLDKCLNAEEKSNASAIKFIELVEEFF